MLALMNYKSGKKAQTLFSHNAIGMHDFPRHIAILLTARPPEYPIHQGSSYTKCLSAKQM